MGNQKRDTKRFQPDHIGTQSKGFDGNKGKKMQTKTGQTPAAIHNYNG